MTLPGNLCIGILEEDNPLKSYYRFKPLLVREGETFMPFTQANLYPEDGCIRIVPDKKESGRFKPRMRQAGLFGQVDLTAHPVENDKIRPNKNYRNDGIERNAYIIYSDAVQSVPSAAVYQIIDVESLDALETLQPPASHAERLLVSVNGEMQPGCWICPLPTEDGQETPTITHSDEPVGAFKRFDLPGFHGDTVSFALIPELLVSKPAPVPEFYRKPETVETAKPGEPSKPKPEEAPAADPAAPKPWICHDERMMPQPPDRKLSPMQQILAQQCGMNPRKGKSLHELIDEKWAQSRIAQLGHSVDIATDAPVTSPIDKAVEAVREAWSNPNSQKPLLEALGGIEEFGLSLGEMRQALSKHKIDEELNDLEAQKLSIERELDHLRENREAMRKQMKLAIRREDAAELADVQKAIESAKAELARWQDKLAEAQKASKAATDALEALSNGELESRLRDFAVNSHIMDLLAHINDTPDLSEEEIIEELPAPEEIDFSALVERVFALAQAKGYGMTRTDAANLCACFAISPVTILSGAPGSGKTATALLIAEALGWDTGSDEDEFDEDIPHMLLFDDCNAFDDPDPLNSWTGLQSVARACLTVRDSGYPMPADMLDKGFMVRLDLPDEDAPWGCAAAAEPKDYGLASLEGIRAQAFDASAITEKQNLRMASLRKWLAGYGVRLSHRALNESCRYCALMNGYTDEKQALDLAVAQRILPALLASAPIQLLAGLKKQLADMPKCLNLLQSTPPIRI